MTSATLETTEVQCGKNCTWVTEWSNYVGEERLGKVRFTKTRFGMHKSYHEDGRHLLLAMDLSTCIDMTYWHLKWAVDGYDGFQSKYSSVVGGKL